MCGFSIIFSVCDFTIVFLKYTLVILQDNGHLDGHDQTSFQTSSLSQL